MLRWIYDPRGSHYTYLRDEDLSGHAFGLPLEFFEYCLILEDFECFSRDAVYHTAGLVDCLDCAALWTVRCTASSPGAWIDPDTWPEPCLPRGAAAVLAHLYLFPVRCT